MRFKIKFILLYLFIFLNFSPPAYAMHIAEGMLNFKWCAFWWIISLSFILVGLRHIQKLKQKNLMYLVLLSTLAAVVFIFSLVPLPVPIAGTTSHPTAIGLSALFLGVLSTAVISFISLFIQAIFLGHGGLTTLGANVFSMGVVGSVVAVFTNCILKKIKLPLGLRVFLVSFLADISTYVTTSAQLALSLAKFKEATSLFIKFILIFLPIQSPIAILEALISMAIIKYIYVHKRQIIEHLI
jgi:cobalt/nickel transport system permease protein